MGIAKFDYSPKPLALTLKPSRWLQRLLVTMGLAAALLTLAWPAVAGMPMLLLVGFATWRANRRYALLKHPRSVIGLRVGSNGGLRVQQSTGAWLDATLLGTSTVTPWGAVLNLRFGKQRLVTHVPIMSDAVDAEDYRRLRVWLRWGREKIQ